MLEDEPRVWDGNKPPRMLHEVALIQGVFVKPWAVPILVVNSPDSTKRTVVSRQGLGGTTSKYAPTGEGGRLAPSGNTEIVDVKGEPMAGDPISHGLRASGNATSQ